MSNIVITSVNLAQPQPILMGNKSEQTGIYKKPCSEAVAVEVLGIAGDTIVDHRHHGGADQAVYIYTQEDYEWWSTVMGEELIPGTFGENLTIQGLDANQIKAGDRFAINNVLLEATFPRIPCGKLASRMGQASFVKTFIKAQRPGFYVRVLQSGILQTGDSINYQPTEKDHPTINQLFNLALAKTKSSADLRHALAAPIAERDRARFEKALAAKQ